jgi:hypothetical protein
MAAPPQPLASPDRRTPLCSQYHSRIGRDVHVFEASRHVKLAAPVPKEWTCWYCHSLC